jgi:hypothetical protein
VTSLVVLLAGAALLAAVMIVVALAGSCIDRGDEARRLDASASHRRLLRELGRHG